MTTVYGHVGSVCEVRDYDEPLKLVLYNFHIYSFNFEIYEELSTFEPLYNITKKNQNLYMLLNNKSKSLNLMETIPDLIRS